MESAEPKKVALQHVGECLWRHTQSGKYYAIVRTAGKQIKKSLRTTDNALAKRRLADFRKKTERIQSGDKSLRFQELAALWLTSVKPNQAAATFDASSDRVVQLNHFFGTREARSITRRDIDDWKSRRCAMKSRLGRPISSRTYNYELQTLNQIFRYGIHTIQCLIENPAEGQKRRRLDTKERLAPTREEFNKLVAALRNQPKASYPGGAADAVELLAYTGCRVGSLPHLTWEHIDFPKKQVRLFNTKKNRWYTLPLFPALDIFLQALRAKCPESHSRDRVIQINDAKNSLKGACTRASLPHFTHHSLRHFLATNAVEAGVDFKVIAGWLDHTDGGVLVAKTYGHLRQDHSAAMAQRMTFAASVANTE